MHIFCCGIPLITTIIGLSSTLGFLGSSTVDNSLLNNYEKFEIEIILLSGIILLLAFILKFKAKKLNCCEKEGKKFCSKSEKINDLLLWTSSSLYAVNLLTITISQIV